MTKRIFAAVLLLCLFVSVVYAQSAATVFGWPPADGSVTNAKLAEPVSVANGGTGKTTAAEALAALGGASLNGSSTVNFSAKDFNASGTFRPGGLIQGRYITQYTERDFRVTLRTAGIINSVRLDFSEDITSDAIFQPLYNYGVPGSYTGRLTLTCEGNKESAVIICRQGGSPEFRIVEDSGALFAITNAAGKYCVYSSGGVLTIKNNTGVYGRLHGTWEGKP